MLELEATVVRLESGELTLDAAVALYERGQMLAVQCTDRLDEATLKVEQLSADGEIVDISEE